MAESEAAQAAPAFILAPTGRLRAAINLGNPVLAQRHPDGRLGGITVALARALARRHGLPLDLHPFGTAAGAFAALAREACDIGFLARDPERAAELRFTPPYLVIEGTALVRADSPIRGADGIDRPGLRIAAARHSAYDLHLSRQLRHASLVHAATGEAAQALWQAGGADMLAGIRQPLAALAAADPALRLLDGAFMRIEQAMAVPLSRIEAHALVAAFLADLRATGALRLALDASGQHDAQLAED
jgi:polar amino acid transport system substrate-binding protein